MRQRPQTVPPARRTQARRILRRVKTLADQVDFGRGFLLEGVGLVEERLDATPESGRATRPTPAKIPCRLALEQIRRGDRVGALETVRKESAGSVSGLCGVAIVQSALGQAQASRATLAQAEAIARAGADKGGQGPYIVTEALTTLALTRIVCGDPTGGRETFRQARRVALADRDPDVRFTALLNIGRAQRDSHDLAGARQSFEDARRTLPPPTEYRVDSQSESLMYLAEAQAIARDWPGAERTLAAIARLGPDAATSHGGALSKVTRMRTEAGDVDGALAWAQARKGATQQAWALLGVAEGLATPPGGAPRDDRDEFSRLLDELLRKRSTQ